MFPVEINTRREGRPATPWELTKSASFLMTTRPSRSAYPREVDGVAIWRSIAGREVECVDRIVRWTREKTEALIAGSTGRLHVAATRRG
jgi:hypothetical protein